MIELNKIYNEDALETLRRVADGMIQSCVTSPPYWGLRNYGHNGQIGLEKTPEEYVAKLVEVFRELRRAMRDDGTLWLVMGDSYAGSAQGWSHDKQYAGEKQATNKGSLNYPLTKDKIGFARPANYISSRQTNGIKPKDLIGIPWMLAFALRTDGWYLRSDIIWAKPNPMPESVTDRPTKSHEYIFLLTKSARYYYDAEAIKESYAESTLNDKRDPIDAERIERGYPGQAQHGGHLLCDTRKGVGRNKRTVWTITTKPFRGAHFATFPPDLIEPCILAGSRVGDLIWDPFMGAGTTGVVAKKLGRNYGGSELNPEYVKMAEVRIERVVRQEPLEFK